MKNHEHLAAHPFMELNSWHIKPVIIKLSPLLMKRVQETGDIRNKGPTVLESSEYYHVTVFQKASALICAVERLENSLTYIHKFPSPRTYEKKGIHQFSWLEYHYSYFVVTYDSLFDIALILTNTVFQLGISEKHCKPSIIEDNAWVKQTSVKASLIELGKIASIYGKKRNLFVHRGDIPDVKSIVKSITDSDMLELLKASSTVHLHSEPIVPLELIDNVFKYESKKIIAELDDDVIKAQKAVARLFDSLLPIYKKKARLLKIVV